MRAVLFLLMVVLSCSAMAGAVVQADMAMLQPVIDRDENGFQACGVRGLVVVSTPETTDLHDFSLMIRHDIFYGTLKAGKMRASTEAMLNGSASRETVMPAPIKFWIAVESKSKAVSPIKIMPAVSEGYILEIADYAGTSEAIIEMVLGERMQFSIRYEDQPAEQVVSFSAAMLEIERTPLMKCLSEVAKRTRKELADKP
jgi:hypothetical protein